jgi:hypothetical protein
MSETDKGELLAALGQVSGQIQGLDIDRDEKIIAARAAGASWTEIGEALGISKQSAWERYRRLGVAS